jgi:hypothetical protein
VAQQWGAVVNLIDRIKSAQAEDARIPVRVDRWDTTIYFRPTTPRDIENITRKHRDFLTNPTMAAFVEMIVARAENEDGSKAFTSDDKHTLLSEPIEIINMIGAAIMPGAAEEIEKN